MCAVVLYLHNMAGKNALQDKKVLLVGLGILGGGLNTALWLLKQGARLTITEMKTAEELAPSLAALKPFEDRIRFVLGRHDPEDLRAAEIVIFNPGVPLQSPLVKLAEKLGKRIENELTLFAHFSPSAKFLAVTGTRGKTTTVNWLGHLLRSTHPGTVVAGNQSDRPLLRMIEACDPSSPVVIETPSFLLERLPPPRFRPKVAVVTNVYRDHLNRYTSFRAYALTKARIFANQRPSDFLILNADNAWTKNFVALKPRARLRFVSLKPLPPRREGAYIAKGEILLRIGKKKSSLGSAEEFVRDWGRHNLENLLAAVLAAASYGVPVPAIRNAIATLPQMKFRQEVILRRENLEIINDTNATSPEATIAAIERFAARGENLILVCGGTDRDLDFTKLGKEIARRLQKKNLILLGGSATEKLKRAIGWRRYLLCETLEDCAEEARRIAAGSDERSIILFSPGAKSFEKFKNEYDRGEQWNEAVRKTFGA